MFIFIPMEKNSYNVIGMMSGTSLDGIDLVEAVFCIDERWRFEIQHAETIPYTDSWREKLQKAIQMDPPELEQLNKEYSVFLADVISGFILKNKIEHIDAVCTHGHTVFHKPQERITLQIGNTPELAKRLGHTVVCDFRPQDVALGGQGAPLVPVGDRLLFGDYDYCLNLGGFANISFDDDAGNRIAFDICPVNTALNHYASKLGKAYDRSGEEASKGKIHRQLLNELNRLEFYASPPPKSLGMEWVKAAFFPVTGTKDIPARDMLSTLVEHIAVQISGLLKRNGLVLVTGGGAYNTFLMERIGALARSDIVIPEKAIVDFKEALIFGFFGVLRLRGEINCLSSATGAIKDHCSGKIFKS